MSYNEKNNDLVSQPPPLISMWKAYSVVYVLLKYFVDVYGAVLWNVNNLMFLWFLELEYLLQNLP